MPISIGLSVSEFIRIRIQNFQTLKNFWDVFIAVSLFILLHVCKRRNELGNKTTGFVTNAEFFSFVFDQGCLFLLIIERCSNYEKQKFFE